MHIHWKRKKRDGHWWIKGDGLEISSDDPDKENSDEED